MPRVEELIKRAEETAASKEEEAKILCKGLVSGYIKARNLLEEADKQRKIADWLRKESGTAS